MNSFIHSEAFCSLIFTKSDCVHLEDFQSQTALGVKTKDLWLALL